MSFMVIIPSLLSETNHVTSLSDDSTETMVYSKSKKLILKIRKDQMVRKSSN